MISQLPSIPTPESLSAYEKLGIVGILLLVLAVSLIVLGILLRSFGKLVRHTTEQHTGLVTKQTEILSTVTAAVNTNTAAATSLHNRIDRLLECPDPKCPAQPRKLTERKPNQSYEPIQRPSRPLPQETETDPPGAAPSPA